MDSTRLKSMIAQIIQSAQDLLPGYLADPVEMSMSGGNVSICIVDETGQIYGTMWGSDLIRKRATFQTAWRKASQVWITGIATGTFEELVYSHRLDDSKFGIIKPDFIGWEGGWPAVIAGEFRIAVAVSGMSGEKDTALVMEAVAAVGGTVTRN